VSSTKRCSERLLQRGCVVRLQHRDDAALERRREIDVARRNARFSERVELLLRAEDDLAGAHADIHQPLDRAQFRDLGGGIQPLAVVVARRPGERIAALPHAQHVLRQPRFPLHGADIEIQGGHVRGGRAWTWRVHDADWCA
jgi:hypothetical protein